MIQELINKAKNKYPASVCYTGQLSKDERRALEKLCDVKCPSVYMSGSATYSIRYKGTQIMNKGYLIKRTNITADRDVTLIGRRLMCGDSAEPYETKSSAESALKRQAKQDQEYCPDCQIIYEIVSV